MPEVLVSITPVLLLVIEPLESAVNVTAPVNSPPTTLPLPTEMLEPAR